MRLLVVVGEALPVAGSGRATRGVVRSGGGDVSLVVVVAAIWPVAIVAASVAGSSEFDAMRL